MTVLGKVQYYSDTAQEIVTDLSFKDKLGLVSSTYYLGHMAKVKVDNKYVLAHPSQLQKSIKSNDISWITPGAIVKINGPVSTRSGSYYVRYYTRQQGSVWGHLGAPGKTCTERFKGRLVEVGWVSPTNGYRQDPYVEIAIKGKKGGLTYAVCWPSSLEPVFTI